MIFEVKKISPKNKYVDCCNVEFAGSSSAREKWCRLVSYLPTKFGSIIFNHFRVFSVFIVEAVAPFWVRVG